MQSNMHIDNREIDLLREQMQNLANLYFAQGEIVEAKVKSNDQVILSPACSIYSSMAISTHASYKPDLPAIHEWNSTKNDSHALLSGRQKMFDAVSLAIENVYFDYPANPIDPRKLEQNYVDLIKPETAKKFYSYLIPQIEWKDYLKKIISQLTGIEPAHLITMLIYLDRFLQNSKNTRLSGYSIYRLMLTTLMLAAKMGDVVNSNKWYAEVGGVSNQEMNQLEASLLSILNFNLYITPSLYSKYLTRLHHLYKEKIIVKKDKKPVKKSPIQQFGVLAYNPAPKPLAVTTQPLSWLYPP